MISTSDRTDCGRYMIFTIYHDSIVMVNGTDVASSNEWAITKQPCCDVSMIAFVCCCSK